MAARTERPPAALALGLGDDGDGRDRAEWTSQPTGLGFGEGLRQVLQPLQARLCESLEAAAAAGVELQRVSAQHTRAHRCYHVWGLGEISLRGVLSGLTRHGGVE
jgi:hypothetical protein